MENRLNRKKIFMTIFFFITIAFLQYRYCLFYRYSIGHNDFIKLEVYGDKEKKKLFIVLDYHIFVKNIQNNINKVF